jgi:shingomyelin synthase
MPRGGRGERLTLSLVDLFFSVPKGKKLTASEILGRVAEVLSGFGLSVSGKMVYCGDYIYSGHTMVLVMTYLVVTTCE